MTDQQLAEMNRILGELKGGFRSLEATVSDNNRRSDEGRRMLHDKFESLGSEVDQRFNVFTGTLSGLTTIVDGLSKRLTDIEPSMKAYREQQLRQEGAAKLGKGLLTGILAAAGGLGYSAHEVVNYLIHWTHAP